MEARESEAVRSNERERDIVSVIEPRLSDAVRPKLDTLMSVSLIAANESETVRVNA